MGGGGFCTKVFKCPDCGRKAFTKDIPFLLGKQFDILDIEPKKPNIFGIGRKLPMPQADEMDKFDGYRCGGWLGIWPDRNNND